MSQKDINELRARGTDRIPISSAAAQLGKLGGRAGTGKAKSRGGKAYYVALAQKSAAARHQNAAKKAGAK